MELVSTRPARWNHNLHYHRVILAAVPDGARRSLDVGCGAGMLARDMRRVVAHVTGIDRDAASIDLARRGRRRRRRVCRRGLHDSPVGARLLRPHRFDRRVAPHGRGASADA